MLRNFDFHEIWIALPLLWEGMQVTLLLTLLGILGGIALGIVLAVMRLSPVAPLRLFATAYVDFFRSLPLVLLIFWFYFLVPIVVGRPVGQSGRSSLLPAGNESRSSRSAFHAEAGRPTTYVNGR